MAYNDRVNVLDPLRHNMSPYSCVPAERQVGLAPERSSKGFCVSGRCGTTVQRHQSSNRHMVVDGFWRDGIARGRHSQDDGMIPSGAPVDRLRRCTDAVAPESIEAGEL